jgi:hypothetical protein
VQHDASEEALVDEASIIEGEIVGHLHGARAI